MTCKKIISFYSDIQRDPTSVKDSRVGQIWYNMISSKPDIEYVNSNYNMRPTISNFIKSINLLFGLDATDLDELTSEISNDEFNIKYDLKTIETPDGTANVLSLACTDFSEKTPREFTINIHMIPNWPNWHAWTTFEYPQEPDNFINQQLQLSLIQHTFNFEANNLDVK